MEMAASASNSPTPSTHSTDLGLSADSNHNDSGDAGATNAMTNVSLGAAAASSSASSNAPAQATNYDVVSDEVGGNFTLENYKNHIGNSRFEVLVEMYREAYDLGIIKDNTDECQKIVDRLIDVICHRDVTTDVQNRGRFLVKTNDGWNILTDAQAASLVRHALAQKDPEEDLEPLLAFSDAFPGPSAGGGLGGDGGIGGGMMMDGRRKRDRRRSLLRRSASETTMFDDKKKTYRTDFMEQQQQQQQQQANTHSNNNANNQNNNIGNSTTDDFNSGNHRRQGFRRFELKNNYNTNTGNNHSRSLISDDFNIGTSTINDNNAINDFMNMNAGSSNSNNISNSNNAFSLNNNAFNAMNQNSNNNNNNSSNMRPSLSQQARPQSMANLGSGGRQDHSPKMSAQSPRMSMPMMNLQSNQNNPTFPPMAVNNGSQANFVVSYKPMDIVLNKAGTELSKKADVIGNNRLEVMLSLQRGRYQSLSETEQTKVADDLVKAVINYWGGRFLVDSGFTFMELSKDNAVNSVKSLLAPSRTSSEMPPPPPPGLRLTTSLSMPAANQNSPHQQQQVSSQQQQQQQQQAYQQQQQQHIFPTSHLQRQQSQPANFAPMLGNTMQTNMNQMGGVGGGGGGSMMPPMRSASAFQQQQQQHMPSSLSLSSNNPTSSFASNTATASAAASNPMFAPESTSLARATSMPVRSVTNNDNMNGMGAPSSFPVPPPPTGFNRHTSVDILRNGLNPDAQNMQSAAIKSLQQRKAKRGLAKRLGQGKTTTTATPPSTFMKFNTNFEK